MGSGIKLKLYLIVQILSVILLAGCKAAPDKSREEDIGRKIDTYMDQYKGGKAASDTLRIETRLFPEAGAEGGEIARYTGAGDQVLRYRITYYGETGKLVENYYFIDDFIYYTSLLESYASPISQEEAKTVSLVSAEGVIIDGICYEYDSGGHTIGKNTIKASYTNLQQLNDLFESQR